MSSSDTQMPRPPASQPPTPAISCQWHRIARSLGSAGSIAANRPLLLFRVVGGSMPSHPELGIYTHPHPGFYVEFAAIAKTAIGLKRANSSTLGQSGCYQYVAWQKGILA